MRRDHRRFGWINRDGKLIIAVQGVRTFAHSAASVLLAIYLDLQGFGLFEIGLFLTIGSGGTRTPDASVRHLRHRGHRGGVLRSTGSRAPVHIPECFWRRPGRLVSGGLRRLRPPESDGSAML